MSNKLSMTTAKGAMMILLSSGIQDIIRAIGCTEDDWKIFISAKCWQGVERPRVTRVMEGLLYGMIDIMGLPKFELPAEFAAALVAIFVNPVNYYPACCWIGEFSRGEDLGNSNITEPIQGFEKCTPRQIFALVCLILSGDEIAGLVKRFAVKTELSLGYSEEFKK